VLCNQLASSKDPAAAGAANKAMYALSALVRLSASAQDSFLYHGGLKALAQLMGHPSVPTKVKDRAMNLMTDLADLAAAEQQEEEGQGGAEPQQHGGLQAAKWDTQLLTDYASAVLQLLQVREGGVGVAFTGRQLQDTASNFGRRGCMAVLRIHDPYTWNFFRHPGSLTTPCVCLLHSCTWGLLTMTGRPS
jgi:hypothetical protein